MNVDDRLPVYLEVEELGALLSVATPPQYLYFLLCARAGFRTFEAIKARHEDIIWQNGEPAHIRVVGKRRKERVLPLSVQLRRTLKVISGPGRKGWLFHGYKGQHISQSGAYKWMAEACARAGIPRHKAHPHALRHSFATHLLRQGVDLVMIRDLMRHKSLKTTEVYLHLNPDRLRSAVELLDRAG